MTIKEHAKQTARILRKNQTPAEKFFWEVVRNHRLNGYKFYRQYPLFYEYYEKTKYFIADFYCHELKLVVEIDGGIHEQQKDYDQIRSEILETQKDLRVIRFMNREVFEDIESVKEKIIGMR